MYKKYLSRDPLYYKAKKKPLLLILVAWPLNCFCPLFRQEIWLLGPSSGSRTLSSASDDTGGTRAVSHVEPSLQRHHQVLWGAPARHWHWLLFGAELPQAAGPREPLGRTTGPETEQQWVHTACKTKVGVCVFQSWTRSVWSNFGQTEGFMIFAWHPQ